MREDLERWPRLLACTWAVGLMALGTGCGDEVPGCVDPPPVTNESSFIQLSPEDSFANVSIDGEAMGTFFLDGTVRFDPCDTSDCAFTVTDLDLHSWVGPDGPDLTSMSVCISGPLSLASTRGPRVAPSIPFTAMRSFIQRTGFGTCDMYGPRSFYK